MKELENLLTSLVQRGWKPFNYIWTVDRIEVDDNFEISIIFITWEFAYKTLRDLVVLESWLWQFVCNNKLYKETNKSWESWGVSVNSVNVVEFCSCSLPQFRLLESALLPEEELGEFLVENIVIEWNQTLSPETK